MALPINLNDLVFTGNDLLIGIPKFQEGEKDIEYIIPFVQRTTADNINYEIWNEGVIIEESDFYIYFAQPIDMLIVADTILDLTITANPAASSVIVGSKTTTIQFQENWFYPTLNFDSSSLWIGFGVLVGIAVIAMIAFGILKRKKGGE